MENIRKRIERGIEDMGGYNSEDFKKLAGEFKKEMTKQLKTIDAKITAYSVGHYYVSGFFRTSNDKCYYFSLSDIRNGFVENLLYRTAEHEKDYSGGSNQYVTLNNETVESMWLK